MNTELEQIKQELDNIRSQYAGLCSRLQTIETASRRERRRLRVQAGLAFVGLLGAVLLSPASRTAIAQGYGLTLAGLNTRLLAVESKTQYLSVDTTAQSATFSGCNVFVQSGGGSTYSNVTNAAGQGLGNLIIGYNALRANTPFVGPHTRDHRDTRTGNHNLIVGDRNNYSSYGGIVVGDTNAISGIYACVTGGYENVANGNGSSVTGGFFNTANGEASSVSGGNDSTASADYAWAAGSYHTP